MPLWAQIAVPAYVLTGIGYSLWFAHDFADKATFSVQGPTNVSPERKAELEREMKAGMQIGMYLMVTILGLTWPIIAIRTVYTKLRRDDDDEGDDDDIPPISPTP